MYINLQMNIYCVSDPYVAQNISIFIELLIGNLTTLLSNILS